MPTNPKHMKVLFNPILKRYADIKDGRLHPVDLPKIFPSTASKGTLKTLLVNANELQGWEVIPVQISHL